MTFEVYIFFVDNSIKCNVILFQYHAAGLCPNIEYIKFLKTDER